MKHCVQESGESQKDESRPLGKHEGAVAQIVAREAKEAKEGKAAKSPKNGTPMLTPSKAGAKELEALLQEVSGQAWTVVFSFPEGFLRAILSIQLSRMRNVPQGAHCWVGQGLFIAHILSKLPRKERI